jgi:UDP-2,3-diacylglucosamine pyrophosphatase LpxH
LQWPEAQWASPGKAVNVESPVGKLSKSSIMPRNLVPIHDTLRRLELAPTRSWRDWLRLAKQSEENEGYYTFRALDAARRKALHLPGSPLARDRIIILSDAHKGDRRPDNDDFLHNEHLYCAALRFYLDHHYRLVLNGDIEEGWKSAYSSIFDAYDSTAFELEREFARQGPGSYVRIYGNHDVDWADPRMVNRHLRPVLGVPIQVYPALVLEDRIFVVHGHQGDLNSDRRAWLSRRIIRYLWRPLQRVMELKMTEVAQNEFLQRSRDRTLQAWATANRLLMIAGHTHRAMFHPANEQAGLYLNDGSCIYTDGLTGIEIDRGEIRLIKWNFTQTMDIARTVFQSADLLALL